MTNFAYVGLSRQTALNRELVAIANNVANASTDGFRRDAFIFSEYVNAVRNDPSISQTRIGGRLVDPSQGALIETGEALDVAIEGAGFFTVETDAGVRLTRAGSFKLNDGGVLSTSDGFAVGGEGGAPIAIPPDAGEVVISADGVVSVDSNIVGRIAVVDVAATDLVREGSNLFRAAGEITAVENPTMRQGRIETSNVVPVLEISRLIEVQRAFEISQQLLAEDGERERRAVEALSGGR